MVLESGAAQTADTLIGAHGDGPDLLSIRNLSIEIRRSDRKVRPVSDVSLRLRSGETLGVVGESGSGKSMTGLAVMGMLPAGGVVSKGSITMDGRELVGLPQSEYRQIRGNDIAMIFQDSMSALNPTRRIGDQVAEPVQLHCGGTKRAARSRAEEVLALVGIPRPSERMNDYPHQLSGGMRQRVMIAMALACEPRVVIADEPTTALDATIQAQILDLLAELKSQLGMAMILVSHDIGVIAGHADRVAVMYAGRVAETGLTPTLFSDMRHRYTQSLLASIPTITHDKQLELYSILGSPPDMASPQLGCPFAPRCASATDHCHHNDPELTVEPAGHTYACWHPASGPSTPVRSRTSPASADADGLSAVPRLRVRNLVREYPTGRSGLFSARSTVKAVSGVSFDVAAGETFGLVGESGCGKSTLGRMLVALDRPTSGEVLLEGDSITQMSSRELTKRRSELQMMFQDPHASLDPRMRIETILLEPLVIQNVGTRAQRNSRIRNLLDQVGLSDGVMERYPHELSGGQRQRVGLARALALDPLVLVADEPVSALDVSVRSQVLNLMRRTQSELGLSSVVISHDLAVVRYLADRVGVMYLGKLVEVGTCEEVYSTAAHPYTAGLLAAVADTDPVGESSDAGKPIRGELPSVITPPSGCHFRTRCPHATELCAAVEPPMESVTDTHRVACHFPLQAKKFEQFANLMTT